MHHERSSIWQMVLTELWKDGVSKQHIAKELSIPASEIETILFGLTGETTKPILGDKSRLRVV